MAVISAARKKRAASFIQEKNYVKSVEASDHQGVWESNCTCDFIQGHYYPPLGGCIKLDSEHYLNIV